jgi:hypothetical protein
MRECENARIMREFKYLDVRRKQRAEKLGLILRNGFDDKTHVVREEEKRTTLARRGQFTQGVLSIFLCITQRHLNIIKVNKIKRNAENKSKESEGEEKKKKRGREKKKKGRRV